MNKPYTNITTNVMIDLYKEIRERKLDVTFQLIYDLENQIEWSIRLMRDNNDKDFYDLHKKYNAIIEKHGNI